MRKQLCKIGLIALALSLIFQCSNAQDRYIAKHYQGDVIPLDSFVVMDIPSYRGIRLGAQLYSQLSEVDRQLLTKSDSIVSAFNEMVGANNEKMEVLMSGIHRRDTIITELESLGKANYELSRQSIGYLEELNEKKNPLLSRGFFIGIAVGVIGMALIN